VTVKDSRDNEFYCQLCWEKHLGFGFGNAIASKISPVQEHLCRRIFNNDRSTFEINRINRQELPALVIDALKDMRSRNMVPSIHILFLSGVPGAGKSTQFHNLRMLSEAKKLTNTKMINWSRETAKCIDMSGRILYERNLFRKLISMVHFKRSVAHRSTCIIDGFIKSHSCILMIREIAKQFLAEGCSSIVSVITLVANKCLSIKRQLSRGKAGGSSNGYLLATDLDEAKSSARCQRFKNVENILKKTLETNKLVKHKRIYAGMSIEDVTKAILAHLRQHDLV